MIEGFSERVTFAQNRVPAQSGLSAFQNEEFKQSNVIVQRNAPFSIMIVDEVVIGGPRASDDGRVGHRGVNPGPGFRWSRPRGSDRIIVDTLRDRLPVCGGRRAGRNSR